MTDIATDHYTTLGVERTARPREIRTAFLRLVRENPPESSSEMFRLVSEAYRVLSNPEKRRHYNTEERLPEEVARRLRVAGVQARTDPQGAEEALRAICGEHPTLAGPRFALGVLLERQGRSPEAATVFEGLFAENPDSSAYAKWLGEALLKTGRQELGLSYLKQAIILDKDDHESYLCLARFFFKQHRYADSLDALDRGIQSDGVADLNDVHLLIHKMLVLAQTASLDDMRATADELVAVVPTGDAEARRWASERLESLERALATSQRPDLKDVVRAARRLLESAGHASSSQPISLDPTREQRAALLHDGAVAAWIKKHVRLAQLPPEDARVVAWNAEVAALFQGKGPEMNAEWERARSRYPNCLEPVVSGAEDVPEEPAPSPPPLPAIPEPDPALPPAPVRQTRRRGRGRRR